MDFRSDLASPTAPEVAGELQSALTRVMGLYGADDITKALRERLGELFERDVAVFPVLTGTAGNAIGLAAANPRRQGVCCHVEAHIMTSEAGSVEFLGGGARLLGLPGAHGQVYAEDLLDVIEAARSSAGRVSPAVLSLTEGTEAGTAYTRDRIRKLAAIAKTHGMAVHLDGARLLNAAVALKEPLAELTWRSGIDILTLGFAKNGGGCADAIVSFDSEMTERLPALLKRCGQIPGRMQFLSAQVTAAVTDGRCLAWARRANEMAQMLAQLMRQRGFEPVHPVEINEVFVELPPELQSFLRTAGVQFYLWRPPRLCRFVTSYATHPESITSLGSLLGSARQR